MTTTNARTFIHCASFDDVRQFTKDRSAVWYNSLITRGIKSIMEDIKRRAFELWFRWHDNNYRVIAKVSGVSLRTVQRWARDQRMPRSKALMVDQVMNGRAVQFSSWRGPSAIRHDWRRHWP